MIFDWIRFILVALMMFLGIAALFISILGTYRFHFALNRIHSAAICDTFCMFFILTALAIASGFHFTTLKILLVLAFMWFTSPLSGHMLTSLELHTDEHLGRHLEFQGLEQEEE